MDCLVTGGAGFIGSHLARRLLKDGNKVLAIDNMSTGNYQNIEDMLSEVGFRFHKLDLRDWVNFKLAAKEKDAIFHLAANMGGIGFISSIGADIMRDNLQLNINFLEACRQADMEYALYASSACIYPIGRQTVAEAVPLKEEDALPAEPNEFYGWEKLATEKMCEAYNRDYGMKVRVLRYHNVFGPGEKYAGERGKAIVSLCRKAILYPEERFIVWGDGRQTRSFCYIDDAIDGTIKRMLSDYLMPINIGSDRLITISELAKIIIGISKKDIVIEPDLTRPQGVRGRNADLTLAKKVLGWEPKISLEEGIELTYKWLARILGQARSQ